MKWSVLIPVYLGDRGGCLSVLRRVLESYASMLDTRAEVVLSCDGPDARVGALAKRITGSMTVRVIEQEHRGQSAASNRAAREARGRCLLFTAQDVVPHPRLLREHEAAQEALPGTMVLGSLPYPPELEVTPFMDYLIHGGPQFAYDRFRDGAAIPPYCLYAPNFSVRRDVFLGLGGFREDLPYACQDSELGIRFAEQGGRIVYRAGAIGYHWHPQTLDRYLPRQYVAGRNTVRLCQLHPRHRSLVWLKERVLECYVAVAPRVDHYRHCIDRFECEPGAWRVIVSQPPGSAEQDALRFLYHRVVQCEFYRGVHDALEEQEPGWMVADFAPWRIPEPEPMPRFFRTRAERDRAPLLTGEQWIGGECP